MSDIKGLLTICRRAGKLILGMDEVKSACRSGKACGVIAASDFSEKSFNEIAFVCKEEAVPLYRCEMTKEDIALALGKVFGIMAVADNGFMKAAAKNLTKVNYKEE